MNKLIILLGMAFVLLLTGCSNELRQCNNNSGCNSGEFCAEGICITPLGSDSDADINLDSEVDAETDSDTTNPDVTPNDTNLPDADVVDDTNDTDVEDTTDTDNPDGNDGSDADNCETRNSCGGCQPLTGINGESCGECGVWECTNNLEQVECNDPGLNACDGCGTLIANPTESCGEGCGGGSYVCDGIDAVRCEGVGSANPCGGCEPIDGTPNTPCGVCLDGINTCTDLNTLECEGAELEPREFYMDNDDDNYGDENDTPELLCEPDGERRALVGGDCNDNDPDRNPEATEICNGVDDNCDGNIDEDVLNDCGGCDELPGQEGQECGTENECGNGTWTCDEDTHQLLCEGEVGEINLCGGCTILVNEPSTDCGQCGTYICEDEDSVVCENPDGNVCGGCDILVNEPTTPCGACGEWVCDGQETVRCEDPGLNACNGCGDLGENLPEDRCGQCGELTCVNEGSALECQDDEGFNLCGGCGPEPTEICDGEDNDCDGDIDEDLAQTTCGLGICTHSIESCTNGQTQVCNPLEGAEDEVCNGLDDDCDGDIDVDDPDFRAPFVMLPGVCQSLRQLCFEGNLQNPDFADLIPEYEAEEQTCDRLDNDCDGITDPNICELGEPCESIDNCVDGLICGYNGFCTEVGWSYISPGSFSQGSALGDSDEVPVHLVNITQSFLASITELTQAEWVSLGLPNNSTRADCETCPAGNMDWYTAIAAANLMSARDGLEQCYLNAGLAPYSVDNAIDQIDIRWDSGLNCTGYRLPTEAEWEFMARGGTTTEYWCGGNSTCITRGNEDSEGHEVITINERNFTEPQEVCSLLVFNNEEDFGRNPNGLCDTIGNVRELVWDGYEAPYSQALIGDDPMINPANGNSQIVVRGSWWGENLPSNTRSANRLNARRNEITPRTGLRLVRSVVD